MPSKAAFVAPPTRFDLLQSTVTRRIQLLERRLGFQLFVRDRRAVKQA
ncbi:LysR family transcriptional regulator [Bradyrhizobium sp. STM 3557]